MLFLPACLPRLLSRSIARIQLDRGDIILTIDGKSVTDANVHDLLVGNDVPGDKVHISVQKARTGNLKVVSLPFPSPAAARLQSVFFTGWTFWEAHGCPLLEEDTTVESLNIPHNPSQDVTLYRIASAEIADRRRLFELFTALKTNSVKTEQNSVERAAAGFASSIGISRLGAKSPSAMESVPFMSQLNHSRSPTPRDSGKSVAQLVDDSIALWTKMVKEEEETKAIITRNVTNMQDDGYVQLELLKDVLSQLYNIFMKDMLAFAKSRKSEDLAPLVNDLEAQLRQLRQRNSELQAKTEDLEGENAKLKTLLAEANRDKDRLKVQIAELQAQAKEKDARMNKLEAERDAAMRDAEQLRGQLEHVASERDDLAARLAQAEADRDKARGRHSHKQSPQISC